MKSNGYFVFAGIMAVMVSTAPAKSAGQLGTLYRINSETESKIQAQVMDRMLGPGRAFAFLEMKAEVKSNSDETSKDGIGKLNTKMPESPAELETEGTDKEEAKKADKHKKGLSTQEQSASQAKKSAEKKGVFNFTLRSMKLRILHDAALSPDKLKAVKEALLALYPEKLKAEDISFVPAAFEPVPAGNKN